MKDKRPARSQSGFTLVEVLIAITILSIGVLGVATLAGTALRSSSYNQALTQAVNLAEDRIEALRSVAFDNLQVSDNLTGRADLLRNCGAQQGTVAAPFFNCVPVNPINVQWSATGQMAYTWTYVVTYLDIDGNGIATPASDGAKRVDVTVSWMDPLWGVRKNASLTTIITRR